MEKQAVKAGLDGGTGAGPAGSASSAPLTAPWAPRTDGKRAILTSERSTVFDHTVSPPPPVDPLADVADPAWNSHGGRVWTPDLVHCRLLNVGDTIARLPSPVRRGFVSLLGDAALTEAVTVKRPPSPAEITIADWTWSELLKRPATQRSILQAMAFGASVRTVSAMLGRSGVNVPRTTVSRWYISERRQLAAAWIADRQLVDRFAWERWRGIFGSETKVRGTDGTVLG